jgi:hypothetical protein
MEKRRDEVQMTTLGTTALEDFVSLHAKEHGGAVA